MKVLFIYPNPDISYWLNLRVVPDFAMTTIYYPFRGTKLGDLCYEKRMVDIKIYISKYLNALTALRRGRFLPRETPAILRRMLRRFLSIPMNKEP